VNFRMLPGWKFWICFLDLGERKVELSLHVFYSWQSLHSKVLLQYCFSHKLFVLASWFVVEAYTYSKCLFFIGWFVIFLFDQTKLILIAKNLWRKICCKTKAGFSSFDSHYVTFDFMSKSLSWMLFDPRKQYIFVPCMFVLHVHWMFLNTCIKWSWWHEEYLWVEHSDVHSFIGRIF
jgi:hypothetical protein